MAIYLGYSDLGEFIVESCCQIVGNKVTFWVVSVKYSEGDVIQTQSRISAEKYFFKCPIKTKKPSRLNLLTSLRRFALHLTNGSRPTKNLHQKRGLRLLFLKNSPGGTRTYNPSVNSRMLCHWATEEYWKCGSDLLSRAVSSQVPSACWGLTSVFGMGTGGTLRPLPPQWVNCVCSGLQPDNCIWASKIKYHFFEVLDQLNQAIDLLVSSSYTHYCASTDDLSTW